MKKKLLLSLLAITMIGSLTAADGPKATPDNDIKWAYFDYPKHEDIINGVRAIDKTTNTILPDKSKVTWEAFVKDVVQQLQLASNEPFEISETYLVEPGIKAVGMPSTASTDHTGKIAYVFNANRFDQDIKEEKWDELLKYYKDHDDKRVLKVALPTRNALYNFSLATLPISATFKGNITNEVVSKLEKATKAFGTSSINPAKRDAKIFWTSRRGVKMWLEDFLIVQLESLNTPTSQAIAQALKPFVEKKYDYSNMTYPEVGDLLNKATERVRNLARFEDSQAKAWQLFTDLAKQLNDKAEEVMRYGDYAKQAQAIKDFATSIRPTMPKPQ